MGINKLLVLALALAAPSAFAQRPQLESAALVRALASGLGASGLHHRRLETYSATDIACLDLSTMAITYDYNCGDEAKTSCNGSPSVLKYCVVKGTLDVEGADSDSPVSCTQDSDCAGENTCYFTITDHAKETSLCGGGTCDTKSEDVIFSGCMGLALPITEYDDYGNGAECPALVDACAADASCSTFFVAAWAQGFPDCATEISAVWADKTARDIITKVGEWCDEDKDDSDEQACLGNDKCLEYVVCIKPENEAETRLAGAAAKKAIAAKKAAEESAAATVKLSLVSLGAATAVAVAVLTATPLFD